MVNPSELFYWTDGFEPAKHGFVQGRRLILIAHQMERRRLLKFLKRIKNYIYLVDGKQEIVYARSENTPAVMKMGISLRRLITEGRVRHEKAIPMEQYYSKFVGKPDREWLARNDYRLI